jgi:hypothetical protein
LAYEKTNWQDGVTPLSAANMNKIEDGIAYSVPKVEKLNKLQAYDMAIHDINDHISQPYSGMFYDLFYSSEPENSIGTLSNGREVISGTVLSGTSLLSPSSLLSLGNAGYGRKVELTIDDGINREIFKGTIPVKIDTETEFTIASNMTLNVTIKGGKGQSIDGGSGLYGGTVVGTIALQSGDVVKTKRYFGGNGSTNAGYGGDIFALFVNDVLIACSGGGGGSGSFQNGGSGGSPTGGNGSGPDSGKGGTQTSGGYLNGAYLSGANAAYQAGAGGCGYYGGGRGGSTNNGGGGGSSYVGGLTTVYTDSRGTAGITSREGTILITNDNPDNIVVDGTLINSYSNPMVYRSIVNVDTTLNQATVEQINSTDLVEFDLRFDIANTIESFDELATWITFSKDLTVSEVALYLGGNDEIKQTLSFSSVEVSNILEEVRAEISQSTQYSNATLRFTFQVEAGATDKCIKSILGVVS